MSFLTRVLERLSRSKSQRLSRWAGRLQRGDAPADPWAILGRRPWQVGVSVG